jgi:hypothetical protein
MLVFFVEFGDDATGNYTETLLYTLFASWIVNAFVLL